MRLRAWCRSSISWSIWDSLETPRRARGYSAGVVAAAVLFRTTAMGQKSFGFFGDSVAEAKRVVWPTRKETVQTTLVVFVLVVVMAAFLAVVDIGFSHMIQWILGRSA